MTPSCKPAMTVTGFNVEPGAVSYCVALLYSGSDRSFNNWL